MPNIDHHPPGAFAWIELITTDQPAAKQFYSSLFGWSPVDLPMGRDSIYTMFKLDGRDAAAAFGMNQRMRDQGVPTHWAVYVAVASADETAAKVAAAGGTVLAQPFDVFDFGRMAVLQDPTGAYVNLWQANNHHGIGVAGVPGTMCWADLSSPDAPVATEFYSKLFGWEIGPGQDKSGYLHIKNGEEFIGGVPPAELRNSHAPPHWLAYFLVTDADASTALAKELGATVHYGPMTMENVGRWSVVADPQGAIFAIFQAAPRT